MTFPLVKTMSVFMDTTGDPFFNAWTLAWTQHQLLTDPLHLFDANIFYPYKLTLAFSEHQVASALLALPVYLLGGSPILVHNVVFFLTFVLSGFGLYLLVKDLTGNSLAAILAGMAFAFSSYRFSQLAHLQILAFQWMPFALVYLHRALNQPQWKNFLLMGLFVFLVLMSSNYLGLIFLIFISFFLLIVVPKKWFEEKGRGLRRCFFTLLAVGILFLPFALPYVKVKEEYGFSRELIDMKQYSARAENYLGVSTNHKFYPNKLKKMGKPESRLFFGFLVMGMAFLGLLLAKNISLRIRLGYGVVLLLSFLLSMGGGAKLFGINLNGWPYQFFYSYVPGFDGMRVPARFAINVGLCLAVLAGFGFALVFQKIKGKLLSCCLVFLLSAGILAEAWAAPLRYIHFAFKAPPVHPWLGHQDDVDGVVFLPAYINNSVHLEMNYIFWSNLHWKKIMNGYSGFFPAEWNEFKLKLREFPTKETVDHLRRVGVNYVVINKHKYPQDMLNRMEKRIKRFSNELEQIKNWGGQTVYRLKMKGIEN